MSDIRILVPASTRPFEDMEDGRPSPRKYPRSVSARSSIHQANPTMFEKLGAPTDLLEWVGWYHEYRKDRGIPECGLMPAVALDLRPRTSVTFVEMDDRGPTPRELTETELEELFS